MKTVVLAFFTLLTYPSFSAAEAEPTPEATPEYNAFRKAVYHSRLEPIHNKEPLSVPELTAIRAYLVSHLEISALMIEDAKARVEEQRDRTLSKLREAHELSTHPESRKIYEQLLRTQPRNYEIILAELDLGFADQLQEIQTDQIEDLDRAIAKVSQLNKEATEAREGDVSNSDFIARMGDIEARRSRTYLQLRYAFRPSYHPETGEFETLMELIATNHLLIYSPDFFSDVAQTSDEGDVTWLSEIRELDESCKRSDFILGFDTIKMSAVSQLVIGTGDRGPVQIDCYRVPEDEMHPQKISYETSRHRLRIPFSGYRYVSGPIHDWKIPNFIVFAAKHTTEYAQPSEVIAELAKHAH